MTGKVDPSVEMASVEAGKASVAKEHGPTKSKKKKLLTMPRIIAAVVALVIAIVASVVTVVMLGGGDSAAPLLVVTSAIVVNVDPVGESRKIRRRHTYDRLHAILHPTRQHKNRKRHHTLG